jgi:hypothetical protein
MQKNVQQRSITERNCHHGQGLGVPSSYLGPPSSIAAGVAATTAGVGASYGLPPKAPGVGAFSAPGVGALSGQRGVGADAPGVGALG